MDEAENLRQAGVRATACRVAVLKELSGREGPVAHRDLECAQSLEEFDRVTLYRTLSTLEEKGLAHRILGTDGAWRYCAHDPNQTGCPGNHGHMECSVCGKMICLTDQPIPNLEIPEGWAIAGKQLLAYGTCPKCSDRKERI